MHKSEYSILKLFKDNPHKEFSTKQIALNCFKETYQDLSKVNYHDFKDKINLTNAKINNAKLHRNILYHLNKLVDEELIVNSKSGNKGEKYFVLNLNEGEELIFKKKRKNIHILKPIMNAFPIEGYEKEKIIFKYEPQTWISRVNALLLQSEKFDLDELKQVITECFSNVNDVICLNDFEKLIENNYLEQLNDFLKKIHIECINYSKQITIVIDMKNITNENAILKFIDYYCLLKPKEINIIFDSRIKDIQLYYNFFIYVINKFKELNLSLYIKNKDLISQPFMIGKAGPYTFTKKSWNNYCTNFLNKSRGVVCCSSTINVDVKRFFEIDGKMDNFRKLINNILKTLFIANSAQRSRSNEYFRNIINLNNQMQQEFFSIARNYIRFWNYGWKNPSLNQEFVIDLIKSTKKEVLDFSLTQEAIYIACGMPTKFNVAFSCAFSTFSKELSTKDYLNIKIEDSNDIYKDEIKNYLKTKEEIFKIFDGGDRVRIFRSKKTSSLEIIREIDSLINLYNLPFFCFDFSKIQNKEKKLTSFFN
ncbi:MAG: hypothetical protein ACLFPJ_05210 [Candidatus Woesearchaeota archaeon]